MAVEELLDESEVVAKLVVENTLDGMRLQFIEDQSAGSYDFDLIEGTKTIGVVEATSARDQEELSATAAIFKESAGGNPIAVGECERVWMLDVEKDARIKPLRTSVAPLLRALEEDDVRAFSHDVISVNRTTTEFSQLGVTGGRCYDSTGPGRAYLQVAGSGSLVSAEAVVAVLVSEAEKEDNRRKLGATTLDERHLFVYIHHSSSEAWIGLQMAAMPEAVPTLPDEVSGYWVASHDFDVESIIFWRGDRTGWLQQGVVPAPKS